MSIITITRLTFREASRKKILLSAVLLGAIFLLIYALGFHFIMADIEDELSLSNPLELNEIRNFLLIAGIFVVNFMVAMMTVLTSIDTISGEIQSGTIQSLAVKPLKRWEILTGKFLGFAVLITGYILLMLGGVMSIVFLRAGYIAPHPVNAILLIWLTAMLLLSITIVGGTKLSTLANGVLVFGLYGIAFIGGWIEQIGSYLPDQAAGRTAVNIGIISSLIMPSEALWKRAVHELQSPIVAALGFSPFSAAYYPSNLMLIYAVFYTLIALAFSIHFFNNRDL